MAILPFQMSIRAFREVWPGAIFPVRVTFFPSGMLRITIFDQDTKAICHSARIECRTDGEGFISIRLINLEIWICKFEKLPISRKNWHFPLITGSNSDIVSCIHETLLLLSLILHFLTQHSAFTRKKSISPATGIHKHSKLSITATVCIRSWRERVLLGWNISC